MNTRVTPLRIFCGYASKDEVLFKQLHTALAVPIRQEPINVWNYQDIPPGAEWGSEIEQQLSTADIIILLVSPSFIASEYCWSKEMQWAITRHTAGEARVIPIILKPTPGWETTPLGSLQALPVSAKPISTWKNRDEAFANVVEGLLRVIHQVQQEDKYPVREYTLGLRFSFDIPVQVQKAAAQELISSAAKQWLKKVYDTIGGTLEESAQDELQKEWILTRQQQACRITMRRNAEYIPVDDLLSFVSTEILLTSPHLTFLDNLVKAGQFSYHSFQWVVDGSIDVASVVEKIHEQAGRDPLSATKIQDIFTHVEYVILNTEEHQIKISFSCLQPSAPVKICLSHGYLYRGFYKDIGICPNIGFRQVHTLFSVQKVLAILLGKLPYKEVRQLAEEACSP
ncbi:MAG TPA: toll/interleukin-1 receptor domain-containing protein [Ktedonobacteraceae bacterium]|nr:toll/interleukin-1 receptor domain-containing protein [Ktedonobacteraceae bacterium]